MSHHEWTSHNHLLKIKIFNLILIIKLSVRQDATTNV